MMINKLFFWLVFLSVGMQAQNVSFADANFKQALVGGVVAQNNFVLAYDQNGTNILIDQNQDGEIQLSEAALVYRIDFRQISNYTTLEGINSFVNLEAIYYINDSSYSHSHGKIGDINIDGLNNFKIFNLSECDIANVSIKNCPNLLEIKSAYTDSYNASAYNIHGNTQALIVDNCPQVNTIVWTNNNLAVSNITNCPNLTKLELRGNSLVTFDASQFTNLEYLDLSNNQQTWGPISGEANFDPSLASLNINGLLKLEYLNLNNQLLSNLDFAQVSQLHSLEIEGNNFTHLSFTQNLVLENVNFTSNPNLEYLFLKNGKKQLLGSYNGAFVGTNIKYICADDSEIEDIKTILINEGKTANVNTYCSFTPGGNFNTISGTVRFDANSNGCDTSDNPFEFLKLKINDGANSGETFAQNDGKYEFYTQAGNFNLTALAENPGLFSISPATFSTSFADSNNNVFTQDICVTANGNQNDAEVVIAPLTGARPGFDATYKLVWRNKGNTTLSGKVILNYDASKMTFQSSSLPYSVASNGTLEFDYTNLKPFANTASEITFTINTPTNSTNPVNSGDILTFNAQITPNSADLTPEDNNFGFNHTVVNSFDPNDIICLEGETVPSVAVGKYMHYVVNFENTGTAEAENIVVKMDINPAEFDINTLQLQNASADVVTTISGNKVEFAFKKIKLQSGGHGGVLLKIRTNPNLVEGDIFKNKAEIYFDYNFPIDTNDYITEIQDETSILKAKINYNVTQFSNNNYPVDFDGSLSTGTITNYTWEFSGNPTVSSTTVSSPTVVYTTPGNYTAKLTVSDADDKSSSQTISFSIGGNSADISTGKGSDGNPLNIDADDDDWKGYDINGTEITPKVRHTYSGWSNADIGNGNNSQWISLNNFEGYYTYKSREFAIPENATDATLNLRSLSFVRNWTYLVKVNPDGSEDEIEITKTQWMGDGAKGWLNSRSPKVENYSLSAGRYYIKVLVFSNNSSVRQSLDVNAVVYCSSGLIYANKKTVSSPTLGNEDLKLNEVTVYPIPTKGEVSILAKENVKSIALYDAAGRVLQTQILSLPSKNLKFNINAGKGIYYLKIRTDSKEITRKVIKE